MKQKWISFVATIVLMASVVLPMNAFAATAEQKNPINEKLGVPIVVYGSNLSADEKEIVKTALRVDKETEVDEITISGQDLAKYIKDSNPNARMFSSAKIMRQDEGKGLTISIVTPDNITQVTSEMYASAMLTAGIEDAIVEIAAPKPVTGHSALVGIYKAYEVKTGETLDIERTDVANDELSVATSLAESAGVSDAQVAELLTQIKKSIAENKPESREEVQKIVEDQLAKFQINLSDKDRQLLVDLMDRISNLNIDFSKLSSQLSDLSSKFEEKFGAILEDEGFWQSVKNFFTNLIDTVSSWFSK
ncbi:DUF1002 domain-containing protein [Lysinibacillus sp. 2017]|uniref:DUF1002 domain-containing protein n=1 Tax=unclassified Lysinibacillus TaxID=2636778 RepID=UPI000D528E8E|nr:MULTISPECIES: DUF1002 domain-containing protein [unclassified Lysinibacillus]AWE08937.1 DUF1002 domain-containing protein [Lysinibacillus sp. 2017]TGN35553.1 DUF1002 domain-containing protein [Lysinibacillus sp. S2017]